MSANAIRRTGRKGWFVNVFDTQLPRGRKLLKGGATKEGAKRKARRVEELQDRGIPVTEILGDVFGLDRTTHVSESLADILEDFVEWRQSDSGLKTSTVKRERHIAEQFKTGDLGSRRMESISMADVARVVQTWRRAETANGTIQRRLSLLSQAFEWATSKRRIALGTNPVHEARRVHKREWRDEKKEVGYYLSEDEFKSLLAAADDVGPRSRDAIVVALHTLLRRGEMLGLEWRDVELDTGKLVVRPESAKNGTARTVPLNGSVCAVLAKLRRARVVPMNSPDRVFGDLTSKMLQRDWEHIRKTAELPNLRWHDLRHSGTALMLRARVPKSEVQRIGGWRCSSQMDRYSRFEPSIGSTDALDRMTLA